MAAGATAKIRMGPPVGGHTDNVRNRGDDSNLDEVANYHAVTAVCAVNDGDVRSGYSEKGSNLWVCAPSKDGGDQEHRDHRGIVTTENSDRYRSNFSGTSAAAPIVSGVAALLRQANPDLTWRDLKLILAASARKNDAANSGWEEGSRKYGVGSSADRYHFNHEYGFGMVDAKAAVDMARGWTNVPTLESVNAVSQAAVTIPPPSGSTLQTVTTTLTLNTGIRFTEFVEVNTDFDHTSFRDMEIELVSPSGVVSTLTVPFNTRHYTATCERPDGSTYDCTYYVRLDGEFRFGSARHLGEDPNGQWRLRLTDHFPDLGGTLRSWNLKVHGHVNRPGAPTITPPITVGADSMTVAWSAPGADAPITAYHLRHIETGAADKSDANWTVKEDVWTTGSGPLQYTLAGLTSDTQYDLQVRAVNSAGAGPWSATATGTTAPPVVPGAPRGLRAAVKADEAKVDLSWTAPISTGGAPITGYKIESSDDGNDPWVEVYTTTDDGVAYTDEGTDSNGPMFEVGTTRYYRVSAINSVGTGPPSNVAVATADMCLEPLGVLTDPVTRTGTWASDCESEGQANNYARYYTFTLTNETRVAIYLTSSRDTYLYLRQGEGRTGTVVHQKNNVGRGNINSRIEETLALGTYTVEATTYYRRGVTGDFTLDIRPVTCVQELGTLTETHTTPGAWSDDCVSARQAGNYHRSYSFTLGAPTDLQIDLTSERDTYLYLVREDGTVLDQNNNVGRGNINSRIVQTALAAGTYTVEATTYYRNPVTGNFVLNIDVIR